MLQNKNYFHQRIEYNFHLVWNDAVYYNIVLTIAVNFNRCKELNG